MPSSARFQRPFVATLLAICTSCAVPPRIYVDHPEVFTRERLLTARNREQYWLEKQLERDTEPGLQGLRQLTRFQGTFVEAAASVGPASSDETSGVGSKAPAVPEAGLPDPSKIVRSQAKLTAIEEFEERLAYRNAVNASLREVELDDAHDLFGQTIYTLKFDVTVLPGESDADYAVLDFWLCNVGYQEGQDQDRCQPTKIDALDQGDEPAPAPPSTDPTPKTPAAKNAPSKDDAAFDDPDSVRARTFIHRWAESVQNEINTTIASYQRRIFEKSLGEEERGRLLAESQSLYDEHGAPSLQAILQEGDRSRMAVDARQPEVDPARRVAVGRDLAHLVADRYRFAFYDLLWISEPRQLPNDRIPTHVVGVALAQRTGETVAQAEKRVWQALVDRYDQHVQPLARGTGFVYSVEPKSYAQNVSDVAGRESMRVLIASLAASGKKDRIAAKEFNQTIDQTQQLLQTIERHPRVVGYVRGRQQFGWLIGPRFAIDDSGRVSFEHTPEQLSMQVSVAIPALATHLKIYGRYRWYHPDGSPAHRQWWLVGAARSTDLWPEHARNMLAVSLPYDPSAVTTTILSARYGETTGHSRSAQYGTAASDDRPTTSGPGTSWSSAASAPLVETTHYEVRAGEAQELVIRGLRLWKNPQVFVGGQRADRVEVLPDMKGLWARFEQLRMPPAVTQERAPRDPRSPPPPSGVSRSVVPAYVAAAKEIEIERTRKGSGAEDTRIKEVQHAVAIPGADYVDADLDVVTSNGAAQIPGGVRIHPPIPRAFLESPAKPTAPSAPPAKPETPAKPTGR
ncbi:MAG: hypothetical protein U0610_05845 [bacterium]